MHAEFTHCYLYILIPILCVPHIQAEGERGGQAPTAVETQPPRAVPSTHPSEPEGRRSPGSAGGSLTQGGGSVWNQALVDGQRSGL